MTYKETLFFVGQCLTINSEKKNKHSIESLLKTKSVDWEAVVKVSTAHYVFPALYINLNRSNFLQYLPKDLVSYMTYITDLNRERNLKILEQAKEINNILIQNNVKAIFLKGTGNLMEGLYEDIAERMIGDIDFIVSKEHYTKTINILKKNEYKELSLLTNTFPHTRHYSRLIKENNIAAVEIHDELATEKYFNEFNYEYISTDLIENKKNEVFLSYKNQLCMAIISTQINDKAYLFKNIILRYAYDIFLLSQKVNSINAISDLKKMKPLLNYYLAISDITLGKTKNILWINDDKTKKYLKKFNNHLENKSHLKFKLIRFLIKVEKNSKIILKIFYSKKMRSWFFEIITSKEWLKQKFPVLLRKN